jgi:DNA-binding LacI/PurR family transcriptional regulator
MSSKPRKITSKHVAELAGVSQTTVSFVLNDVETGNISEATRQRVLDAARELNYVPNIAARSLARGRSNNIAFVITQPHQQIFMDEYIPTILTGLHEYTTRHGVHVLVELMQDDALPGTYMDLIRSREVAGMLLNMRLPRPGELEKVAKRVQEGFPIVTTTYWHRDIYSVSVDTVGGARQAVQHLVNLGHRIIALIGFAPPRDGEVVRRWQAYRDVLEQAGLPYDERYVGFGDYDPDTGYTAMRVLLEQKPLPTALFAMNDVMAFGALQAIREAVLRVPDDIAIIGFDGIRLAPFASPPLTTMQAPDVELGRQAAAMLVDLINGKPLEKNHIRLEPQLVIRESCGARQR